MCEMSMSSIHYARFYWVYATKPWANTSDWFIDVYYVNQELVLIMVRAERYKYIQYASERVDIAMAEC